MADAPPLASMTTEKPILEVRDLHAGYGQVKVLHGMDFVVNTGGVTALLGANGAGKTTTLRAISGMVRSTGDILYDGERINALSTEAIAAKRVGHVPDGRGTFMELTVEENLKLGAYTRRDDPTSDLERICSYFPKLKQRFRQQAGTLSGGEQQMLAIGRALMIKPRLLLLDEPSFGQAPLLVREIFEIMRQIIASERTSILLVEQNAALALTIADMAYLLETGRIVMSGPADVIRRDETLRRSYLGY